MSFSAGGLLSLALFLNSINNDMNYKPYKNRNQGSWLSTVSLIPTAVLSFSYLVKINWMNKWFSLVGIREA